MRRYVATALPTLLFVLTLTGCDNFVLSELFSRHPLTLVPDRNPIEQGEEIPLFVSGGGRPYLLRFPSDASDFYHDEGLGTLSQPPDASYRAADSIGTVTIRAADSIESIYDLELTIVPPRPTDFTVDGDTGDNHTIELTWGYGDKEGHTGFRVERSTDGEAFELVDDSEALDREATAFTDEGLNPNQLYHYRIYTVAGEYESRRTEPRTAYSDP